MLHTAVQKGASTQNLVAYMDAGQERAASKQRVYHQLAVVVANAERRLERGHTDARVEHAQQRDEPQELASRMEVVHERAAGGHKGDKHVQQRWGTAHRWNWQAPGLEEQRWSGIRLKASGGGEEVRRREQALCENSICKIWITSPSREEVRSRESILF